MILSNYYKSFESVANQIDGWKTASKNDLLNAYIDHEDNENLKNAYMAAIMCRYWGAIYKYYQSSKNSVSVEDCFEWLTHAVQYALKHRKWRDPNNKLYNDPKAPDKVVNRCIVSTRQIFYQSANNANRKINYNTKSIQALEEADLSYVLPADSEDETSMLTNICVKQLVAENFIQKDTIKGKDNFISSFILDAIMNGDVFIKDKETGKTLFNNKRLIKHIKHIDDKYCQTFSEIYNVDLNDVKEKAEIISKINNIKLYKILDKVLASLRHTFTAELTM